MENAFRQWGGVPLTLNLDNLKAAVLKADWADPELNPKVTEFARHYGVVILPCKPRTPQHKGKVENSVAYVKGNALAARSFTSLAAQNAHLSQWESMAWMAHLNRCSRALDFPLMNAGWVFPR